jgi:hypothetical protein
VAALILRVDPSLPTTIKFVRQFKARKVFYDVQMTSQDASQAIRDAYGLFWRKKSGRRLPPELKGISFSNATTFPTRVRLRLLKELCRKHQLANPNLSCFVTSYLARPELKIRDRKGLVTSLSYTEAIQQLPHHLTLSFLQDLYQYAKTNLPEKEVIERFLILTPDLLLGETPEPPPTEHQSMSIDVPPPPQPTPHAPVEVSASSQVLALQAPVASLPSSGVTYAALASLPPSTSGATFSFVDHSSTPTSTAPATTSPTYAILTPVQVSPTDHLPGSFLTSIPSSGLETSTGDDFTLVQRNRHRFAHKSAPYPIPN